MKQIIPLVFATLVIYSGIYAQNTGNGIGSNQTNPLAGYWKFIADQLLDRSNNVIKQDTDVAGLLIYTPDGKVSVQFLWKGTRASILNDTLINKDGMSNGLGLGFNTWNLEQARNLIDTYDANFGDYRIDWNANTVTHIVKGNLRPEKKGQLIK